MLTDTYRYIISINAIFSLLDNNSLHKSNLNTCIIASFSSKETTCQYNFLAWIQLLFQLYMQAYHDIFINIVSICTIQICNEIAPISSRAAFRTKAQFVLRLKFNSGLTITRLEFNSCRYSHDQCSGPNRPSYSRAQTLVFLLENTRRTDLLSMANAHK